VVNAAISSPDIGGSKTRVRAQNENMQSPSVGPPWNRRRFVSTLIASGAAARYASARSSVTSTPTGEVKSQAPDRIPIKAEPFSMTQVRLLEGPFKLAQDWNLHFLEELPVERLVLNFQSNAGLPGSAQALGGWERPDCELRGHFTGHFLSGCSLMYSTTGSASMKAKVDETVSALATCQRKFSGGYLSAFPVSYFERLRDGQKVWAPFYTLHKIMAGLLDAYLHCGNRQALDAAEQMAVWTGNWTAPLAEPVMQQILKTEFGGMSEVLYNLYAVTGDPRYRLTGDRFSKKSFVEPLALHRDELQGLHANTHIPQAIGAARRYELLGERPDYEVASFFWNEVTGSRSYVTGGTGNAEFWQVPPGQLALELTKSVDTAECCCVYNMLKLTRHLYRWNADPRYFDYYERVLFNHRLGAIHPQTGATMYYLSLTPGAWKTFSTTYDSFWCCTGTGVEEFSKLNNSIYFHDSKGLFVNLFISSELNWPERGLHLTQETSFPNESRTRLRMNLVAPAEFVLRVRVPSWTAGSGTGKLNGAALPSFSSGGSYIELNRRWQPGDLLDLSFPMELREERMPDDPNLRAFLYGPIVLAGKLGAEGLSPNLITGPSGPKVKEHPMAVPSLRANPSQEAQLSFHSEAGDGRISFVPLNTIFDVRYSVYWRS
jgi:uncharacterized protein